MSGVEKQSADLQPPEGTSPFHPAEELFQAADSQSGYVLVPSRLLRLARGVLLLGGCFAALGSASLGSCILAYLLVSTSIAPASDRFSQELFFDYTKSDAVASVSFLPQELPSSHSLPKSSAAATRVLVPGSKFDVDLELELPDDDAANGDIFQVTGKLISGDGREAAVITRPCVLPYRSSLVRRARTLLTSPVALIGLWNERQIVRIQLFTAYTDKADPAFVFFKALLRARAGVERLPRVYRAVVHVTLRLGWLGRLLFLGRPGAWSALLLGILGACALGGGCVTLLAIFALWLLSGSGGAARPRAAAGGSDDNVSEGTVESDVSSGVLADPDTEVELEDADNKLPTSNSQPNGWAGNSSQHSNASSEHATKAQATDSRDADDRQEELFGEEPVPGIPVPMRSQIRHRPYPSRSPAG